MCMSGHEWRRVLKELLFSSANVIVSIFVRHR